MVAKSYHICIAPTKG